MGSIRVSGQGAVRAIRIYEDRIEISLPLTHGNSGPLLDVCQEAVLRMHSENGGMIRSAVKFLRDRGWDVLLDGIGAENLDRPAP